MILPTPGPVTSRPELREAPRTDVAPRTILTFQADSLAPNALTGPGTHQRKAA